MFRSIFKRRGTADKSKRRERGSSAAPASAREAGVSQGDTATHVDLTVDEAMMAISRELSGLARMEVGQAAKERGWATLHGELERRPVRAQSPAARGVEARGAGARGAVRAGAGSQSRGIRSASPRWIMVSAAAVAVVAVVVALAAVYGGGDGPTVVSNPPTTGTVTSVVTSDTTLPNTTVPTDVTTVPTVETTVPTGNTTPTTSTPTSTGGTTPTSDRPVTTDRTTVTTKTPGTTQPPSTTTTNETQMATAQHEKDAKRVAQALGSEVLLAFQSGSKLGDVSSLVADGADVTWMVSTLVNPDGCHVSTKSVNGATVSVVMTFNDVIPDGQGGQREVTKRFIATVRVGDDRAVITAISYAGS
ncbi:MAG: hypothetical protein JXA87_15630 [Thermoleophilia bacterium]|nr:hypothetical protein [Thermoleophilia bacterium]